MNIRDFEAQQAQYQLWCSTNVCHMLDLPPCELEALMTGEDVDEITQAAAARVVCYREQSIEIAYAGITPEE